MRVTTYSSAAAFLRASDDFVRSEPFSTNVIAVIAGHVIAGHVTDDSNYFWAAVDDGEGRVVGVALHDPPYALFVSRMPEEAAIAVAAVLADAGRPLPGVNGAVAATRGFAEEWRTRTGQSSSTVMKMRMYRLGRLERPTGVPGAGVRAAPTDVELVARWFAGFHREAARRSPVRDWRAEAERRVTDGEVHLWRHEGVPAALAAVRAPAAGVSRVGPVYTPPTQRRNGFGAAVTAEATAAALAAGAEHVALYTDLANPTSNSIYQAIGYRGDHDADERVFGPPNAEAGLCAHS